MTEAWKEITAENFRIQNRTPFSEDERAAMCEAYEAGRTYEQIAALIGRAKGTVGAELARMQKAGMIARRRSRA